MWYTALLLGLTGSLHCAGMCSPLIMAVTNLTTKAARNRLVYNGGRILTYGILGIAVSSVGYLLPIRGYQNIVSIAFGIGLVLFAFFNIVPLKFRGVHNLTLWIKNQFTRRLTKNNSIPVFTLGMLNGLIPCGLSIVALTYCIVLQSPLSGFSFMLFFGLGTLPVMIGFAPLLIKLMKYFNLSMHNVTSTMMVLSGIILITYSLFHGEINDHVEITDIILCR